MSLASFAIYTRTATCGIIKDKIIAAQIGKTLNKTKVESDFDIEVRFSFLLLQE